MAPVSSATLPLKSGDNVMIKSAAPEDAAVLLSHELAVIGEGKLFVSQIEELHMTEGQKRYLIIQSQNEFTRLILVAEVAGSIAGALFFEAGARKRLSHRGTPPLSVGKNWRGRGVGSALLQFLVAWAEAQLTIEKLSLAVFVTNLAAIGLYRKFGFFEEGCLPREIKLGADEYMDDILMYRFV